MVLVFGGTTEGRRAVEVLEEAGTPYYYSTRSDGQKVELVNGTHLTGDLDVPEMTAVCRVRDIRLIVDAAHPFAEELHRNLLFLAKHVQVPIIRYDRIYPPRDQDLIWCKDYEEAIAQLEAHGISRLLALTGVNTIAMCSGRPSSSCPPLSCISSTCSSGVGFTAIPATVAEPSACWWSWLSIW